MSTTPAANAGPRVDRPQVNRPHLGRRVGGLSLTGSWRFARHQMHLWRRTWYGSAFSVFIAPFLYLTSIGIGLGTLVEGGQATDALGGVTYAAFAGTGLMAGSAMQSGANDMAWSVLGAIKYTRTWIGAVATPLQPADLFGGKVIVLLMRLLISSAVFAASLAILRLVAPLQALAAIPPAVLTGTAVGVCMCAVAVGAKTDFAISGTFRFVVTPLFIVSGTFFPIDQLPALARPLAALSPLWHGVELLRLAALGIPSALPATVHVVVLLVWTMVGGAASLHLIRRRLQP